MKRLNKIARRIIAFDEVAEQFITECENSGKFNNSQMKQISEGFEDGLTKEQIQVYAKTDFSASQMEQIRYGFEMGLTMKQVEIYANPKFNAGQMQQIYLGFNTGLTMEQIRFLANPEFSGNYMGQMFEIRQDLRKGMSIEEVKEKYDL